MQPYFSNCFDSCGITIRMVLTSPWILESPWSFTKRENLLKILEKFGKCPLNFRFSPWNKKSFDLVFILAINFHIFLSVFIFSEEVHSDAFWGDYRTLFFKNFASWRALKLQHCWIWIFLEEVMNSQDVKICGQN